MCGNARLSNGSQSRDGQRADRMYRPGSFGLTARAREISVTRTWRSLAPRQIRPLREWGRFDYAEI
jgi:hypothetical protein